MNKRIKGDEKFIKVYNTVIKKLYRKNYGELDLNDTNSIVHYLDSACTAHLTDSACVININKVSNVMIIGVTSGKEPAVGWGHLGELGRAFIAPGANVTAGLLEPPPPHEATRTPRARVEVVKTTRERKCFM
jgi:hypothetical protein